MNEQKLKKLFDAARKETAPTPPADFAADVLRAIRREKPVSSPQAISVFDLLNRLFPKLACAAVAVIALGIAADFALAASGLDVGEGLSQISTKWLLTPEAF